ncbi:unnamed protein product [Caenorhabditis nigoni]
MQILVSFFLIYAIPDNATFLEPRHLCFWNSLTHFGSAVKYAKKVRARRGSCGFKLLEKIAQICGDISAGSEVNLATICCSKQCPDSYIQASACPDKKA